MLMTQGLVLADPTPLRHCQDLSEELENITVTMTTTVEMGPQRSNYNNASAGSFSPCVIFTLKHIQTISPSIFAHAVMIA